MSETPRILIVSAMRDEGPYILDWLAHYIGAGAQDFLIYSNDCTDGTDDLLDCLAGHGVLTHERQRPAPDESAQWGAFRAAWKSDQRKAADWALVCDVDEYISIKCGQGRFQDVFAAMPEGAQAIAVPWRLFGSGGQVEFCDHPVPDRFTRSSSAALIYPVAATFFKTLFRCDGPFNQFGVHRPSQKDPARYGVPQWLDGALRELNPNYAADARRLSLLSSRPIGRTMVEMNHYSVRSVHEFLLKSQRGLPHHRDRTVGLDYWVARNFNTQDNHAIAPMAPARHAARARLMALPGVAECHAAAVEATRHRIRMSVQDAAGFDLLSRLILAGGSHELTPQQAHSMYHMYQRL